MNYYHCYRNLETESEEEDRIYVEAGTDVSTTCIFFFHSRLTRSRNSSSTVACRDSWMYECETAGGICYVLVECNSIYSQKSTRTHTLAILFSRVNVAL